MCPSGWRSKNPPSNGVKEFIWVANSSSIRGSTATTHRQARCKAQRSSGSTAARRAARSPGASGKVHRSATSPEFRDRQRNPPTRSAPHVQVRFRRRMAGKSERGGVSCNAARALYQAGGSLLDGFHQLDSSSESMAPAGTPCGRPRHRQVMPAAPCIRALSAAGFALHAGERRADIKPEPGIERERAVMKRGLHQPDPGCASFGGAVHHGLHELTADSTILHVGADGERPIPEIEEHSSRPLLPTIRPLPRRNRNRDSKTSSKARRCRPPAPGNRMGKP
jgi:hypothetical protein